ncbi:MAG: hypothetical protein WA484_15980 [Solirubrobacteraceae bacterium]
MSTREGYVAVAERVLARQALQAYAERRMVNRDTTIIAELAPLIARAKAAGLDVNTIAALACGRKAGTP